MKPRLLLILITVVGLALALTSTVKAQPAPTPLLKVDVPFAFMAGGMHLAAGTYDLLHVGTPNMILIRGADLNARVLVPIVVVSEVEPDKAVTKLVFNRYGDQYFLAQVWTGPDPASSPVLQVSR